MSILTKVCVVVMVVVALLACPVFVKQATVLPHYKKMFEMEQRRSSLLRQDRDNNALALGSSQEQLVKARAAEQRANSAKIRIDAMHRTAIAKLELTVAEFTGSNGRLQAENSSLVALHKDDQRRIDEALAVNVKYRERNEILAEGKARIEDLLAESRASHRNALALAKVYREQAEIAASDLAVAAELVRKCQESHGGFTKDGTTTSVPIHATILAVKDGIASINAGSAKGVKAGIRLVVHRGARFVGYLKIVEVEAQESAGLMVDAVLSAQQGDKVTTEDAVGKVTAGG